MQNLGIKSLRDNIMDYRGEWKVIFSCIERNFVTMFPYEKGDRVAQIYFEPVHKVQFEITAEELSATDRGVEGFGTSGLK